MAARGMLAMSSDQDTYGAYLGDLLEPGQACAAWAEIWISGLSEDSRTVRPGDLFFARPGGRNDGRQFITDAVSAGAVAVISQGGVSCPGDAVHVRVEDVAHAIGEVAHRFHGRPSERMRVLGVTGTNGKTSVTHFVAQALDSWRQGRGENPASGVIGTMGFGTADAVAGAGLTTPDAIGLHARLAELEARGLSEVAMEVSSHALDQKRAAGVRFYAAAFTNLSRDHLDYHVDMDEYAAAKARLFDWASLEHAVLNIDDSAGRRLGEIIANRGHPPNLLTTSIAGTGGTPGLRADALTALTAHIERADRNGLALEASMRPARGAAPIGGRFHVPLLGPFNASNLMTAAGLLLTLGLSFDEACRSLSAVRALPGRMQPFGGRDSRPLVVVDYSHTPDALVNALAALSRYTSGRVWCVFGCGGERDPGKRPLMAQAAAGLADELVVTDDNPRFEDGDRIVADIVGGLPGDASYRIIRDRDSAIAHAVLSAAPGDAVLVAGKGHEEYQEVEGERRPFSDAASVRRALGRSPDATVNEARR